LKLQASKIRSERALDEDSAWSFVLTLGELVRAGASFSNDVALCLRGDRAVLTDAAGADLVVHPFGDPPYTARSPFTEDGRRVLSLCIPLCVGPRAADLVVAHLGQSADGRVAVPEGTSRAITSAEDVRHTHRLRALSDAVIVGANTALVDDPLLTTRHVRGRNPARVILDPRGRLSPDRRLFRDGAARSLVVTTAQGAPRLKHLSENVEIVVAPEENGALCLAGVRRALAERRLRRLFVEGGGVTVSRFLDAGLVTRLHVAVAPKIIGTGEPALQLGSPRLAPLRCRRFLLGQDVLFDFDVAARDEPPRGSA
jgi:riboflavin-specific deaminase-like protein